MKVSLREHCTWSRTGIPNSKKIWVLSRDWKTSNEGAEVTRWGKLFQMRAAATGKARSPTVDCGVQPTMMSDEDEWAVTRDGNRTEPEPNEPN